MGNAERKITKAQVLNAVMAYFEQDAKSVIATVDGVEVIGNDIVEYCNVTLDQLAGKAQKAKEKAAEKKANDIIADAIIEVLAGFDVFVDANVVTDKVAEVLPDEDISKGKIVARFTKLYNAGKVEKSFEKNGKSKIVTYKLVKAEVE